MSGHTSHLYSAIVTKLRSPVNAWLGNARGPRLSPRSNTSLGTGFLAQPASACKTREWLGRGARKLVASIVTLPESRPDEKSEVPSLCSVTNPWPSLRPVRMLKNGPAPFLAYPHCCGARLSPARVVVLRSTSSSGPRFRYCCTTI